MASEHGGSEVIFLDLTAHEPENQLARGFLPVELPGFIPIEQSLDSRQRAAAR